MKVSQARCSVNATASGCLRVCTSCVRDCTRILRDPRSLFNSLALTALTAVFLAATVDAAAAEETNRRRKNEQEESRFHLCLEQTHNAWVDAQKPRASPEAVHANLKAAADECRRKHPTVVSRPPPGPPKQSTGRQDEFMAAIKGGDVQRVRQLLDQGLSANTVFTYPTNFGAEGRSPALVYAVNNSSEEIVDLLVQRGANVRASGDGGYTALHAAANSGRLRTMGLLLSGGADINTPTGAGHTPLHAAVQGLDMKSLSYLIANGARIDATDKQQRTPLMHAIVANGGNQRLPMIREFVKARANPNIPDNAGNYPLHVAIDGDGRREMIEVVRDLIAAGARLAVTNRRGETPLQLAERLGRVQAAAALRAAVQRK